MNLTLNYVFLCIYRKTDFERVQEIPLKHLQEET